MWVHNIDPVAISVGPLQVHWYGLMYLIGFAAAWWLGVVRARKAGSGWNEEQGSDRIFWGAMGVVLGGRMGYVLFYNFDKFLADPLWLFAVWEGGMSFHGGLLGVVAVLYWFGRQHNKTLFEMADFVAPLIPIGLGAGRVGNFIGGELWGRVTDVSWGVVFPRAGDLPRHPSQLYEFVLEGVVLFVVLWWFSSKPRPRMAVSGLFLVLYGLFRSLVEFVREPDSHLQFIAFEWLTMGQLLSVPMVVLGGLFLLLAYTRQSKQN
ncbi:prolipoprotein diacylglyceryl transferase [Neptuniibacter sp.]|uniref:prolipoprotein diacylglyceryl transferase n=1 Tax=Neptuniibacter sp. TaxID=1962643 RepID=UPI002620FBDC|nr:prolipoprotein diacylglyceryl transferase [Neptuniibacter sp.]MCP4595531.1 prolipoprotein diacylglyceryl transferase [Neptuniibacter sp.]